jgi:hypothetical protein
LVGGVSERVFPLQVDRARLDCLVRTTVSALSDSASCRVVRTDERSGGEMLCFGSSVSPGDCRELVRSCAALVDKLGDRDGESPLSFLSFYFLPELNAVNGNAVTVRPTLNWHG